MKARWRTSARGKFLTNRAVNDWNSLPDAVVGVRTVNGFKAALDRHWANEDSVFNYKA